MGLACVEYQLTYPRIHRKHPHDTQNSYYYQDTLWDLVDPEINVPQFQGRIQFYDRGNDCDDDYGE